MIEKLRATYKLWKDNLRRFSKEDRYTLGEKIDRLFIETLEAIVMASLLNKEQKIPFILRASTKLDVLKFFLQLAWETQSLQTKHYTILSEPLNEVGRMLGGWKRTIETQQKTR